MGFSRTTIYFFVKGFLTENVVFEGAFSWWGIHLSGNSSGLIRWTSCLSRSTTWRENLCLQTNWDKLILMHYPFAVKQINIVLTFDLYIRALLGWGKPGDLYCMLCRFFSGSYWKPQLSSPVMTLLRNLSFSTNRCRRSSQTSPSAAIGRWWVAWVPY
jgi:hypothetical protein